MNNILYLVDQPALIEFCNGLQQAPWLALDTEFIREQTYYPQLCLIQIASADQIACIDPLALPSLEPLLEVLYRPTITKVLHAAYQDLEIFYYLRGAVPTPIFDTQLAASALGYGSQVGYANLVQQMLGVELEKTYTRADWRQRPLPSAWLTYAANDVRYLRDLYQQQQVRLTTAHGASLTKLTEACSALADPIRYQPQPLEAWRRVREHQRLHGVQRAVLRALAAWREEQAMRCDRPRRWILHDGPLLELARHMPDHADDLKKIHGLPPATLRRYGSLLLERMAAARAEPPEQWPV